MANTSSFVQHALDLFGPLAPVTARSMFGGHGLYAEGMMFGLLDDGELFLKTDETSRPPFVAEACRAWVYPSPKGPMTTSYFQPPAAALEEPEAMRPWFALALETARRAAAAKAAKKRSKMPASPKPPKPARPAGTTAAPRGAKLAPAKRSAPGRAKAKAGQHPAPRGARPPKKKQR